LRDRRWYVVRNAVQLSAAAGHRELTHHAPRLLRHPEVQVRREVVRALERFDGPAASSGLTQALTDSDSSVRTLAARAIGPEVGPETQGVLLAHIESRDFSSLPSEEMEAFFGAYAGSAQERAVPLLERSWRKRLFSPRPMAFRVAAVLALGRVGGPAARAALEEASKSGDQQIKRAAVQAVQSRSSTASRTDS
jgi:HEAT repeat protein